MDSENSGAYINDCQIAPTVPHASSPEVAERLWELSEKIVSEAAKN